MTSLPDYNRISPSSSAASFIVSNADMLTQILLCLPVKSLLVFKSVSKQWFFIISDPFFINKYNILQNSLSIRGLYTQTWRGDRVQKLKYISLGGSSSSVPIKTLTFINDPLGITIVQSCNGLVVCRTCCLANDRSNVYPTYYICNPSTRQYRPIVCESQKFMKGFQELSSVSLAYDPHKSPHYKVVCIWLVSKLTDLLFNYKIEIYSSDIASWKLSGEAFSRPIRYHMGSGVFWNGSLHWIDTFNVGSPFYFNVDRELRMGMEMPPYDEELGMKAKSLMECKGHLYLTLSRVLSPTGFEIWEMKTDHTGWNKRYIVNLQELLIAYPWVEVDASHEFDVLLVKEVEGESPNLILRVLDRVISYDLHDMSFKEIQQLGPDDPRKVRHQHIQTLACV